MRQAGRGLSNVIGDAEILAVDASQVAMGHHDIPWDDCARLLLSTGLDPDRLAHALAGTGLEVPVPALAH